MKIDKSIDMGLHVGMVGALLVHAGKIGMNCKGYGFIGYNYWSGNVYLWLENYNFTLFYSEFNQDCLRVCYTNLNNGDETIIDAEDMTLDELEQWMEKVQNEEEGTK